MHWTHILCLQEGPGLSLILQLLSLREEGGIYFLGSQLLQRTSFFLAYTLIDKTTALLTKFCLIAKRSTPEHIWGLLRMIWYFVSSYHARNF